WLLGLLVCLLLVRAAPRRSLGACCDSALRALCRSQHAPSAHLVAGWLAEGFLVVVLVLVVVIVCESDFVTW
ncbi:MAG: hypothetical protein RL541_550, partial [Pseudomonadota bacterium]